MGLKPAKADVIIGRIATYPPFDWRPRLHGGLIAAETDDLAPAYGRFHRVAGGSKPKIGSHLLLPCRISDVDPSSLLLPHQTLGLGGSVFRDCPWPP